MVSFILSRASSQSAVVDRGGDLLTYPSPRFPAGLSEVTGVSTGRGGPSDRGVCERHDFRVELPIPRCGVLSTENLMGEEKRSEGGGSLGVLCDDRPEAERLGKGRPW
mmetsp:Transcript_13887/g.26017  ORF Transcript_13887/g.26017 Transcript_13887/m.26017 type:complete len:108 (+) Transcript_13887:762-1085(+)